MRLTGYLVEHYPLALGLAVLLLPYIFHLLLLPFTFGNYLLNPTSGKVVVKSSSSVSLTQSRLRTSPITTVTTATTTTGGGFNLWKGIRYVVGPRKKASTKSTRSLSKSTSKSKPTKAAKVKTVKDIKTVTKKVTQTVQVTLEKPVEAPNTDGSVVIEEISIMGWHQVLYFRKLTDN
jgi:hypothetical protein